jgi:hypothetical protein
MKTLAKIGVVVIVVLFALTACNLFDQINIRWDITGYGLSGSLATVSYNVWNDGKFDLTGVNLEVAAYVSPAGVYKSAWTLPDFSLAQKEMKSGSYSFSISPYSSAFGDSVTGAAILGVDMDKPNG